MLSYKSFCCEHILCANFSITFLNFREGLQWTDIDWNDNGECLDLIERVSLLAYCIVFCLAFCIMIKAVRRFLLTVMWMNGIDLQRRS